MFFLTNARSKKLKPFSYVGSTVELPGRPKETGNWRNGHSQTAGTCRVKFILREGPSKAKVTFKKPEIKKVFRRSIK